MWVRTIWCQLAWVKTRLTNWKEFTTNIALQIMWPNWRNFGYKPELEKTNFYWTMRPIVKQCRRHPRRPQGSPCPCPLSWALWAPLFPRPWWTPWTLLSIIKVRFWFYYYSQYFSNSPLKMNKTSLPSITVHAIERSAYYVVKSNCILYILLDRTYIEIALNNSKWSLLL